MFQLKHDIRIELKNEKEVFRFVRLLIFTFVLSATLLGISDYIWNMTLWRISIFFVPWLVAIPAFVNCIERKVNFRELLGAHILQQILIGIGIGTAIAVAALVVNYICNPDAIAQFYPTNIWQLIRILLRYVFSVGLSEELIYRVAIMGSLHELIAKRAWLAPLIANTLFALSHLFQHNWANVCYAFVVGIFYTLFYDRWKKCGFVMVVVMHGMYDFMLGFIPYIIAELRIL